MYVIGSIGAQKRDENAVGMREARSCREACPKDPRSMLKAVCTGNQIWVITIT